MASGKGVSGLCSKPVFVIRCVSRDDPTEVPSIAGAIIDSEFGRARRGLFDPDEVESKGVCGVTLSDISGDKGDGQSRCSLKRECGGNMQRIERSKTRFLDQFLGLTEYDRSHLYQFPISSVFVQS